jgi:hypothetical protein
MQQVAVLLQLWIPHAVRLWMAKKDDHEGRKFMRQLPEKLERWIRSRRHPPRLSRGKGVATCRVAIDTAMSISFTYLIFFLSVN